MAEIVVRNYQSLVNETSQVRDVSNLMPLLQEDPAPLYVLTNAGGKKKVRAKNPLIEFFDDADLVSTTTNNNGTDSGTGVTSITVTDGTLFGVRDMVQVAKPAANGAIEEIILVTAIAGNVLTIQRGFAGTSPDTIYAANVLKILGVCQTESGTINNPRTPLRQQKQSGCQIFEWPMAVTKTGAATEVYGGYNERDRQHMLGMRRQRLEIENAGLFGVFSETLNGVNSSYSSMGVRSILATNVVNAGQTFVYQTFLNWSYGVFQYSGRDRLLIAAPLVKSALDYTASAKQLTKSEDTVFGISLRRFVTSNGTYMLVNDYNMTGGQSDEAIAIDMSMVEFCVLENNGVSMDTKLYKEYDTTNPKVFKDLLLTQAGWRVHQEARHGRLYNVTAY